MFFIPLNEKPAKMIKVCSEVDKLVDVEPPLIRNIDSSWSGDERVWRNFGFPDLLPALKGEALSCNNSFSTSAGCLNFSIVYFKSSIYSSPNIVIFHQKSLQSGVLQLMVKSYSNRGLFGLRLQTSWA